MSDIRTQAYVYIGLVGIERFNDQQFKNEELNKWIEENVDFLQCNYAKWGRAKRGRYLAGIYLTPDQASFFKLKFDI